jgi:hypothetical protein
MYVQVDTLEKEPYHEESAGLINTLIQHQVRFAT